MGNVEQREKWKDMNWLKFLEMLGDANEDWAGCGYQGAVVCLGSFPGIQENENVFVLGSCLWLGLFQVPPLHTTWSAM